MFNINEKLNVKFKKLNKDSIIPEYAKLFDSGIDLISIEDIDIYPGNIVKVHTGLSVELPSPDETYPFVIEMQIRPRSGLAAKYGITILNTPGTIDNQYRGELIVIMVNHNSQYTKETHVNFTHNTKEEFIVPNKGYHINKGDKIAQAVIVPILSSNILNIVEVDELNKTIRGTDGFGSTGIN